jgi:hypothetical protein
LDDPFDIVNSVVQSVVIFAVTAVVTVAHRPTVHRTAPLTVTAPHRAPLGL